MHSECIINRRRFPYNRLEVQRYRPFLSMAAIQAFHKNLPCPVTASKNKWANDWSSHWFYHKVALDLETKTHPLVIDHIPALGDVPMVASHSRAKDEALFALLRKLSKTFSTRDLIEEFVMCGCFPFRAGWMISSWLTEDRWIEGIPLPDFLSTFNLRADREFSFLVFSCRG